MDVIWFMIQSFIIGVVEGVTEFLPVSSTGHLIIVQNLLGFKSETPGYVEMYTYVIQLGAILAVMVLYYKKILKTLETLIPKKGQLKESGFYFWFVIVVACIPGAIVQISLDEITEKYLFNPISVAITLFVGGILMILAEKYLRKENNQSMDWKVTMKQAIIIGCFQCLAIIPGMSRSASTIIGGWVAGLTTVAAAEFSFFLAIPVMMGMSALKLFKFGGFSMLSPLELSALILGFVVSFVVALVVVKSFISYLKHKPMKVFAIYRMIFAVVVILAGFAGVFNG
jgi:undecaprenyl-diphosphatase